MSPNSFTKFIIFDVKFKSNQVPITIKNIQYQLLVIYFTLISVIYRTNNILLIEKI